MKTVFKALVVVLFAAKISFAATETIEQPIRAYGTPTAISVSTSVYTNVTPSGVRIEDMTAILINNPTSNNATVQGHLGNCTSTAVSTSTVKGPFELAVGAGGSILLDKNVCLWLISRHTSAETIVVQAIKQN